MRLRPQALALVLALGLHASVLAILRGAVVPTAPQSRGTVPSPSEASVELDLDDDPVAQAASEGLPEAPHAEIRTAAHFVPRTTRAELEATRPETSAVVEGPPPVVPGPPTEVEPSAKPLDLGIGPDGWQRWVSAPEDGVAPLAARSPVRRNRYQVFRPAPVSTTGGLQEGLEESDRALGLGPQGRVLSALREAAHASEAPEVGAARFEVIVHRTGAVEVTLASAAAQREQWKLLAAHIASDLRRAPPRIPAPRAGLKLLVELVLEQTLPNGTKVRSLKKPHLDAPLKFQRTEDAVEQLERDNPTTENPTPDSIALKLDAPGLYVAESNKVCDYRVGVGSIAPGSRLGVAAGPVLQGACDPSNIGAKPQRTARTRVLEESVF